MEYPDVCLMVSGIQLLSLNLPAQTLDHNQEVDVVESNQDTDDHTQPDQPSPLGRVTLVVHVRWLVPGTVEVGIPIDAIAEPVER